MSGGGDTMLFHAIIGSPLGPILLAAEEAGLAGLYFTDQRDCPRVAGLEATVAIVSDPSAGRQSGRPIRLFKAQRSGDGASGDLFASGAPKPPDARPSADLDLPRFLQGDSPSEARRILRQAQHELQDYWRGDRRSFDVPLSPRGTDFQRKIWAALLAVPFGSTLSYGELGERAGLGAGHGRAVGTAVGSNPISIIIPCHRILARNRTLNGYGGGLPRKVRLLQLEGFDIR